jgi:hypothetical protein
LGKEVVALSVVAPDQRRLWAVLGITLAFAIATYTTIAFSDPRDGTSPGTASSPDDVAAGPPQAPWKISVHGSGAHGKMTKVQKVRLERQEPQLRSVIRRIYDAVLVHPNRLPETLKANFTPLAARALRRADVAATRPGVAATSIRKATIGVDVNGLRVAVASVSVRAKAGEGARPVVHRSTLWLERGKERWRVVAFDVNQAPLAEPGSTKATGPGKATNRKKSATKDRGAGADERKRSEAPKGRDNSARKGRKG